MPQTSGIIAGLGRVKLVLEATPQPSEIGGSILATAILTKDERGREQEPLSGQTIVFWLGPDEVYSHPTNDHGRASYTFAGLGFGAHAISVQHGGLSVTFRHAFERKGRKLLMNVWAAGDEGRYLICIAASWEGIGPAAGIRLRIALSYFGRPAELTDEVFVTTDSHGFVSHLVPFDGPECDAVVQGPDGFEKKIENLYGRSRHPRLTEADLEPRPGDLSRNVFRVIWRALRRP